MSSHSWKLIRQGPFDGEYEILPGEWPVGRDNENKINCPSIVVSRRHCLITVLDDGCVYVKDLKSSNGTYIDLNKITPLETYSVEENQKIGIGINETKNEVRNEGDKFIFKLIKVINEPEYVSPPPSPPCPSAVVPSLKRKAGPKRAISSEIIRPHYFHNKENNKTEKENNKTEKGNNKTEKENNKTEKENNKTEKENNKTEKENNKTDKENNKTEKGNKNVNEQTDSSIVNLLSDSESDDEFIFKRIKLEKPSLEEPHSNGLNVEKRNDSLKMNPETEFSKSNCPITNLESGPSKIKTEPSTQCENDHSDIDKAAEIRCDMLNVKMEYGCDYDDPIEIDSDSEDDSQIWFKRLSQSSPGRPSLISRINASIKAEQASADYDEDINLSDSPEIMNNIISSPILVEDPLDDISDETTAGKDYVDANNVALIESSIKLYPTVNEDIFNVKPKSDVEVTRQIEMREPHHIISRRRSHSHVKVKTKSGKSHGSSGSKERKRRKSTDVKDERRKKLKEIACKNKDDEKSTKPAPLPSVKQKVNAKITSSNRGAFLVESTGPTKAVIRRVSKTKDKDLTKSKTDSSSNTLSEDVLEGQRDMECQPKSKSKASTSNVEKRATSKPIPEGKISTKVKRVHFSTQPDQVLLFEIEPGNKLTQTSLCRNTLRDVQQLPVFTLEKSFLMSILQWNPSWLSEQLKQKAPPPILPHKLLPLRHTFESHTQYASIVYNLLLMEVWECISQTYNRQGQSVNYLNFVLESSPPPPTDKNFGPVSISVNFSMPRNDSREEPRIGELLVLHYGEEKKHFYYVQNVKRLPSPPNNVNSFFQLTLSTPYRDTLRNLRSGQELKAQNLGFIKNVLTLILSVDYLRGSPLNDIIIRPEPEYFPRAHLKTAQVEKSEWTSHLNHSQMEAVESSVHAALSDQPSIQLVQGPPGTGKSSVICSIVMRYFYGNTKKRHANRNKLLICTTSNAAIDELVLRLLNIRKTLPKPERFRMVRVGREAAMAPEAKAVSSQQLTRMDLNRVHETGPQRDEEIMFLEAKVNSWKSAAESASHRDASRAAYCADRAKHFADRLKRACMASGDNAGGMNMPPSADHMNSCEKRVIEGADIIMTTLASCANQKLKCLRRRIALCIIDEAGQAIEPEALLPLALDVSRLTLIGDPQQLPGFISSQWAKQYGLGESLFSRISQCAADWEVNPVVLLDHQYRMHPEIALYPNKTFYKGLVGNGAKLRQNFPLPPYRLMYISSGNNGQASTGVNEMEAWAVSRVVLELSTVAKSQGMSLGVITPYRAHKDCILSCLHRLQGDSPTPIEVNTIDSFQGQERDIVVVSLARSQGLGFLADAGRMTVTLTRAKHALLVCLNPNAITSNALWQSLMNDANARQVSRWLPRQLSRAKVDEHRESVMRYIQ